MRVLSVLCIALICIASTSAFRNGEARVSVSSNTKAALRKQQVNQSPFALKMSGDVVAAKKVEPAAPNKSFMDSIWNDNTKLMAYLSVWYLGNIYCKF